MADYNKILIVIIRNKSEDNIKDAKKRNERIFDILAQG